MIWLFERGAEIVRLVTRYDDASKEYSVVIEWTDGRSERESFTDLVTFDAWIVALERQLAAEHWTLRAGSPEILADGWRGPMSVRDVI